MAVSGNRSPSPISARSNPNPRTPEPNSTTRRSFTGNPFPRPSILTNPRSFNPVTPANSPADFARRHSIGKESEKENEKDQNFKPAKVRSPAISKGSKNFMTPTFSAASKVNSSPRKKVLAEKNELVRASISYSDGKSPFGSVNLSDVIENLDSNSDMGLNQNKVEDSKDDSISNSENKKAVLEEIPLVSNDSNKDPCLNSKVLPLNSQNLSDMKPVGFDSTSGGNGLEKKPLGSSVSPIIAPLDADPSLPPYDPKTNYLSPRPQFLHYKPNPRIELYFHKEKSIGTEQGKRLEESFMTESFSDTETTEEIESESSRKESEDEAINEEVEPHVPIITHISNEIEEKRVIKPLFFTRLKFVALVLALLVGCLSVTVTDSPVFDSSVYKDSSISKLYNSSEMVEFAKASFDDFARKFKEWSASYVYYLRKLVHISDDVDKLCPLQFSNLTYSLEDPFIDGYLKLDHIEEKLEEIDELEESEPVEEGEVELELLDENLEGQGIEEADFTVEAEVTEPGRSEVAQNQEQSDTSLSSTTFEDQLAITLPEFSPEVEVHEVNPEVIETGEIQAAKLESTIAEFISNPLVEMDASFGDVSSSEELDFSLNRPEDKFSVHDMKTISLLALALVAAILVFVYLKHRKTNKTSSIVLPLDPLVTEKLVISSPELATTKHTNQEKSSQVLAADVDLVGESCPSQMSSFQKSSSHSKRTALIGSNEAQSQERKQRRVSKRESLASSSEYSMGSPSYGSFTTYEKIPTKHGCGEEEIVTPVRRSSRIKNQVTSP